MCTKKLRTVIIAASMVAFPAALASSIGLLPSIMPITKPADNADNAAITFTPKGNDYAVDCTAETTNPPKINCVKTPPLVYTESIIEVPHSLSANKISISSSNGQILLTIDLDTGKVEKGPGYTSTESGEEVLRDIARAAGMQLQCGKAK